MTALDLIRIVALLAIGIYAQINGQGTPPAAISPAPAYTCNCGLACSALTSCAEAYYQLNTCGCSERDGDGIPCESICP